VCSGCVLDQVLNVIIFITSIQWSILRSKSKEAQAESYQSSEVSCHRDTSVHTSGTSDTNLEFSSKHLQGVDLTSKATQSTVEASAKESLMEQRVDLNCTANQSSSMEVSESASEQDVDLTI